MAPRDFCFWWWQIFTTFPSNVSLLIFVKRYSCNSIWNKSRCIFAMDVKVTNSFFKFWDRTPTYIKSSIISNGNPLMPLLPDNRYTTRSVCFQSVLTCYLFLGIFFGFYQKMRSIRLVLHLLSFFKKEIGAKICLKCIL